MKSKNNETILMLSIVFAIIGGIMLAYSLSQPIVYEKEETTQLQSQTEVQTEVQTNETHSEAQIIQSQTTKVEIIQNEVVPQTEATVQTEATTQISYPINLNTATVEELMTIPNVGESRAYAIVDYREELGGYTSVDQIMNIYGIGEGIYYEIAGYLTV